MKLLYKMLLLVISALAGIVFLTWFASNEMAKIYTARELRQ